MASNIIIYIGKLHI